MNRFLFLVLNILFFAAANAQSSYTEAIQQGDSAFNKREYKTALNKYLMAGSFDPTKKDTVRIKVNNVYDRIDALRKEADKAKMEAEEAKKVAIKQGNIAIARQLTAQGELIRTDPNSIEESSLLALKSLKVNYTPEAEELLRKNLSLLPSSYKIFFKQQESIQQMKISADQKYLVTTCKDSTAVVWNIETRKIAFIVKVESEILFIDIDPQSKHLATGCKNGIVILWDISDGKKVYQFQNQPKIEKKIRENKIEISGISAISFLSNGQYLAVATSDGIVYQIDVNTRLSKIIINDSLQFSRVLFCSSFRGNYVAAIGKTKNIFGYKVIVWDMESGIKKIDSVFQDAIIDAAFDPKGLYFTTASKVGDIDVWNVQGGTKVLQISQYEQINLITFSPNGTDIWTASDMGKINKWEIKNKLDVVRITENEGPIRMISVSPDGQFIAAVGFGKTVRVWAASNGKEVARLPHEFLVASIGFIEGSKFLATTTKNGELKIWQISTSEPPVSFYHPVGGVNTVSISKDEKYLFAHSGKIPVSHSVWDITGKVNLFENRSFETFGNSAVLNNDGNFFLATVEDSVWKYDWRKKNVLFKKKLEGIDVRQRRFNLSNTSFSNDGKYLVKEFNGNFLLWKIDSACHKVEIDLPENIEHASFNPSGSFFVTISRDEESSASHIEIFDLITSKSILKWKYPQTISLFAVSNDNKYFALPDQELSKEREIEIGGEVIREPTPTVLVFNLKEKKEQFRIKFKTLVTTLAFSPDNKYLAGGEQDGTIQIFRIQDLTEVSRIPTGKKISEITFSPQQNFITVATDDGFANLYYWQTNNLITQACACITRNFTLSEWKKYLDEQTYDLVCKNLSPHPSLLEESAYLAWKNDLDGATKLLRVALKLGAGIDIDSRKWIMREAAKGLVERSLQLAIGGEIKAVLDSFAKAKKMDPNIKISAEDWNELAWQGAVWNEPVLVKEAINHALELEPENGAYRDTRGVIRALTNNFKGAIEDFEFYVKSLEKYSVQSYDKIIQRKEWIETLKSGKNPFDNETLSSLRW